MSGGSVAEGEGEPDEKALDDGTLDAPLPETPPSSTEDGAVASDNPPASLSDGESTDDSPNADAGDSATDNDADDAQINETAENVITEINNSIEIIIIIGIGGTDVVPEHPEYQHGCYQIVFDSNGGRGTMRRQTLAQGQEAALHANAFTRKGFSFVGWNTEADGSGASYEDGALVKDLAACGVVTLYAQWSANSYRVVFDGNGATEGTMEDQIFVYGEPQELNPNAFKRSGYRFLFWVDDRWDWVRDLVDAIMDELSPQFIFGIYFDGEEVVDLAPDPNEPFVLHAVWREMTHVNINYQVSNQNGGTLDRTSERLNPESGIAEGCTLELTEGYRLVSWTNEEGQIVSDETTFVPQKVDGLYQEATYTANVEPVVYNITYNLEGGVVSKENPSTYTVEDSFVLNMPSREGYTFQGWTGTGLDQATKSVAVRRGSTGDREYTAVWSERPSFLPRGFSFGGLRGLARTGDGVSLPALGAIVLLAAVLLGLSRTARRYARGTHFLDD